jgi:hypothetical protein
LRLRLLLISLDVGGLPPASVLNTPQDRKF